jgi:hypothetical protein
LFSVVYSVLSRPPGAGIKVREFLAMPTAAKTQLQNMGTQMRRLKLIEHISLDGVIQHSTDDDDFSYSDWTTPYRTPAGRDAILAAYGERFDLLLGRRTYDIWSGFWPKAPSSPMADRLNAATKFCRYAPSGES